MLIKKIQEITTEEWDTFCLHNSGASFRHTSQGMHYYESCAPQGSISNCSFAIFADKQLIGIAPLFKTSIDSHPHLFQLGLGQNSAPFPVIADEVQDNSAKWMKAFFTHIDKIAFDEQIAYSHFCCDVLSDFILNSKQKFNPLLKYGYHEASTSSNVMPLYEPEELLFKRLSKGHRSDVQYAEKMKWVVDFIDNKSYKPDCIQLYKQIHESAAGGPTGQAKRWQVWDEFIKTGFTTMALLREPDSEEYIAGGLFITYKKKSIYGSGAIKHSFKGHRGIGHLIQWEVMKHFKSHGYTHHEIGANAYPVLTKETNTPKLLNIGHFKSQFGGDIFPLFIGEKFYSKNFLYAKHQQLLDEYVNQHAAFFMKAES